MAAGRAHTTLLARALGHPQPKRAADAVAAGVGGAGDVAAAGAAAARALVAWLENTKARAGRLEGGGSRDAGARMAANRRAPPPTRRPPAPPPPPPQVRHYAEADRAALNATASPDWPAAFSQARLPAACGAAAPGRRRRRPPRPLGLRASRRSACAPD
jgi:hypothetical protein